jgi:hypothetical protein
MIPFSESKVLPFLWLALLSIYSCKEEVGIINPNSQLKEFSKVDFSDLSKIEFMILGKSKNIPLQSVKQAVFFDSIFASTHYNSGFVFFHDYNGEFMFSIKPSGKGPLEINEINLINKYDQNHLILNDPSKNTLFLYDIHKRKIVREIKTGVSIFAFEVLDNKLIYLGNDFLNGLVNIVDNFNFEIKTPLIMGSSITNMINSPNPFVKLNNDELAIGLCFHDSIYIYNKKNAAITKKYAIGVGETSIQNYNLEQLRSDIITYNLKKYKGKLLLPMGDLQVLCDYLIIALAFEDKKAIIFNYKEEQSYFYNKDNDLSNVKYLSNYIYPKKLTQNKNMTIFNFGLTSFGEPIENKDESKVPAGYYDLWKSQVDNAILAIVRI